MVMTRRYMPGVASALVLGVVGVEAMAGVATPFEGEWFGLHEAGGYAQLRPDCEPCPVPALVRHWFRDEVAAVPVGLAPDPVPGSALSPLLDVQRWLAAGGGAADRPPYLVWHGSPSLIPQAAVAGAGDSIRLPGGESLALGWAPRLAQNRAWMDESTFAWLDGRELRLRGRLEADPARGTVFVARSVWPREWRLPAAASASGQRAGSAALSDLIVRDGGGARAPFETRWLWTRSPGAPVAAHGRAVLALMLNGAQGDDDEALGGHFAFATGWLHADGRIDHWLVTNFYGLGFVSEKGILPATLPLDAYMGDVNSGQAWYRPSYMLAVLLDDAHAPRLAQHALNRVLERFQRRHVEFDHARANCTGLSLDALEGAGWNYPHRGPNSRLLGTLGFFASSLMDRSFGSGRETWHYMMEEQARLLPRAGFEILGADLLALVAGGTRRALTDFETRLRDSAVAVAWLRFPQIPSSRAWGRDPAVSPQDYLSRVPSDRSQWNTITLEPRALPGEPRDWRPPAPLLSDTQVGVAGFGLLAGLLALPPLAWWAWRRRRVRRLRGGR